MTDAATIHEAWQASISVTADHATRCPDCAPPAVRCETGQRLHNDEQALHKAYRHAREMSALEAVS